MCLWFHTSWAFPLSTLQTSKIWSSNRRSCDTPLGGTKVTAIAFHVRPMLLLCGLRFGVALLFCRSMGELGPNQLDECGEFGLADCLCGLHCLAKSLDERRATELLGESAWPGGCFLPWIWMGHIFRRDARAQICQQTGPLIRSYQLNWSPLS